LTELFLLYCSPFFLLLALRSQIFTMTEIQAILNHIQRELDTRMERFEEIIIENQRPAEEVLLGEAEIMKLLGISKRTLATMRAEGIILYSKLGKKIIYRLSDILDAVKRHQVVSEASKVRVSINDRR